MTLTTRHQMDAPDGRPLRRNVVPRRNNSNIVSLLSAPGLPADLTRLRRKRRRGREAIGERGVVIGVGRIYWHWETFEPLTAEPRTLNGRRIGKKMGAKRFNGRELETKRKRKRKRRIKHVAHEGQRSTGSWALRGLGNLGAAGDCGVMQRNARGCIFLGRKILTG